jgi:transposase
LGKPVEFLLTPGQRADISKADGLLAGHDAEGGIADKGYDSGPVVRRIEEEARAVIPAKKNRKSPRDYDQHLYKERNKFERFIHLLKEYRRVATRCGKTAPNYMGVVYAAAVVIFLR